MAQTGFLFSDEGKTISVTNDSGTTAVTAGDLVYSIANDDALTGTAARARAAYAIGDVKVKSLVWETTTGVGYKTPLGVALEDIPVDSTGSIALEGIFMHPVLENTEAGGCVQMSEVGTNQLAVADNGTTASYEGFATKIGRALTGGSADGKYILWKLTL